MSEKCLPAGYICYDDGCHLKRYASHPERSTQTPSAQILASLSIVIDKMHFKGHVDEWCKQNCNPYSYADLNKVSNKTWTIPA